MTNSLMEDVRVEEFDTIVTHYQESLEKNLKLLKYSGHIPSLREIQSETLRRSMISMTCVVEGLASIIMEKGESMNLELLLNDNKESDEYRLKIFSNPRYKNAVEKYLKFLYKRGMIDVQ